MTEATQIHTKTTVTYASFNKRFLARFIDICITGVLSLALTFAVVVGIFIAKPEIFESQQILNQGILAEKIKNPNDAVELITLTQTVTETCSFKDDKYVQACQKLVSFQPLIVVASTSVSFLITVLYFVLFTASSLQATPGKLLLGLKVMNYEMHRVSFIQAFAREIFAFLKLIFTTLSAFLPFLLPAAIGLEYIATFENIWIIFDKKSQTIHDKIAQTFVIKPIIGTVIKNKVDKN